MLGLSRRTPLTLTETLNVDVDLVFLHIVGQPGWKLTQVFK